MMIITYQHLLTNDKTCMQSNQNFKDGKLHDYIHIDKTETCSQRLSTTTL